jgi:hypothetical protein
MPNHADLTTTELHESKGTDAATVDEVFVADGAGSGEYKKLHESSIDTTGHEKGRSLISDGAGGASFDTPVWNDLQGKLIPKASGAGSPNRTTYIGNISDYAFALNDIVDINYHIPHDYAPGTDIFLHMHWSHTGTNISGTLEVTFFSTIAAGHDVGTFGTEIAPTITRSSLAIGTAAQRQHLLDEIQLSATSPSATQFDTATLVPDTIIIMSVKLTTLPTVTAGALFLHEVDIHYQSSFEGTANKVPDFYV